MESPQVMQGPIFLEDIRPGMSAQREKLVTLRDIELFAEVSTDRNPLHLDEDFARQSRFGGRVAHGLLSAGLVSAIVGEQLPGIGTIYMGQTLRFLHPVRAGDLLIAKVTVLSVDLAKRRATLETTASVGQTTVLKGEALVLVPSRNLD